MYCFTVDGSLKCGLPYALDIEQSTLSTEDIIHIIEKVCAFYDYEQTESYENITEAGCNYIWDQLIFNILWLFNNNLLRDDAYSDQVEAVFEIEESGKIKLLCLVVDGLQPSQSVTLINKLNKEINNFKPTMSHEQMMVCINEHLEYCIVERVDFNLFKRTGIRSITTVKPVDNSNMGLLGFN